MSAADIRAEFPSVIDSTMLASFRGCPRQMCNAYVLNLRPPGESIHLIAGAAFAAGCEAARRAYFAEGVPAKEALLKGLAALSLQYGDVDPAEKHRNKSWHRVAAAFEAYFDRFPLEESMPPFILNGKPCIEFSFAIPLDIPHPETGDPLILAGRTDMIGERNGCPWLVDEKTSSQLGETWSKKWDLRAQFANYAWACREHGINLAGCIIRGVGLYVDGCAFSEAIIYHPDWVIDRWYRQTVRDIKRAIQCWNEGYWDFQFGDSCTAYGGCAYQELCKRQRPEEWLHLYEVHKWNPLERKTPVVIVGDAA